jgi:hypothetical protein
VPLDGRAVLAENTAAGAEKYAAHSKPGDIVRLSSPQEIKLFTAQTMNDLAQPVGRWSWPASTGTSTSTGTATSPARRAIGVP